MRAGEVIAVNAIASFETTTGSAEAARRATSALVRAGVRVALDDRYNGAPLGRQLPESLLALERGRPHPIDLCFINLNEDIAGLAGIPRSSQVNRYTIGFFWWELTTLPDLFAARLNLVDEIWVGSDFTRGILAGYTDRPVLVMPPVVEPIPNAEFRRSSIGVVDDAFVFLFNFDAYSTLARKNPLGVIEAFSRAFGPVEIQERVKLVIKTINLNEGTPEHSAIRTALDRVNGIHLAAELSAGDMAALIAGCDAYVSLHRAEGFGFGMAEAMYFGRPVIATAYSGSMDFTREDCACLVGGWPLRVSDTRSDDTIISAYHGSDAQWADPNLDQAAAWMRRLVDDAEVRQRIGEAGRRVVRAGYSEAHAGRMMADRLKEILASLG